MSAHDPATDDADFSRLHRAADRLRRVSMHPPGAPPLLLLALRVEELLRARVADVAEHAQHGAALALDAARLGDLEAQAEVEALVAVHVHNERPEHATKDVRPDAQHLADGARGEVLVLHGARDAEPEETTCIARLTMAIVPLKAD